MGCRICVEAPLEMPLDLTVLFRSSTVSSTLPALSLPLVECRNIMLDTQSAPGYRRVATFPLTSGHQPGKLSNMKYRWASESTNLHTDSISNFDPELLRPLLDSDDNCNLIPQEDKIDRLSDDRYSTDSTIRLALIRSASSGDQDSIMLLSDQPQSPSKLKKRVAFADDRGLELASVRIMTESSDVPPKINYPAIMRSLLGEGWVDEEAVAKPCATWVVGFKQPASDYIAFRTKVDQNAVSVENVLVKNDHCRLVGTVKVKNISYEKTVFVRFTDNDWKSYYDRDCKHSPSTSSGGSKGAFDTFQFDFEIPCDDSKHQRIQFCVCFRTGQGQEFWDNNEGDNYEIIGEQLRLQRCQMAVVCGDGKSDATGKDRSEGILNSSWTEFAKWKDSRCVGGPYW